jgi:hypothetical protein
VSLRAFIARRLRYAADRIDPRGAPRAMSVRFTFEERVGIVFRQDNRGCRLWYLGDADYERAHDEAGPVDASATAWLPQRTDRPAVIRYDQEAGGY